MRNIRPRLERLEARSGLPPEHAVASACALLTDEEIEALTDLFSRPGLPWEIGQEELLKHAGSEAEVRAVSRFWILLEKVSQEAGREKTYD